MAKTDLDPRLATRRRWAKMSFGVLISTVPVCFLLAYISDKQDIEKLSDLAFIISPALAGLVWIVHEYFKHCFDMDVRKEDKETS